MTMNQFAFIDPESTNQNSPDLVFHMKCSIEIGQANCETRRRRQASESTIVDVSYTINGTEFEIDDGIVHAMEQVSSYTIAVLSPLIMTVYFL